MLHRYNGVLHEKGLLVMKWIVGLSVIVAISMGYTVAVVIHAATVCIDNPSLNFLLPNCDRIVFDVVDTLKQVLLCHTVVQNKGLSPPPTLAECSAANGFDPTRDLDKVT